MATVISLLNHKGGVGKTTSTINIGAGMVELGKRVMLIDLDPQAHLSRSVGLHPDVILRASGEVLLNQASIMSVARETGLDNLDILPSNPGLLVVDKLLYKIDAYEYRLKNILDQKTLQLYDFIIIDCPPNINTLTINAITASQLVIIPITCDYYSAHSLRNYLSILNRIKSRSNPEIDYRILITLFERRTKVSHLILDQYRNVYSIKMFTQIISMDVKIRESAIVGKPVTLYSKQSRSANEYRNLAWELLECLKTKF